MSRRVGTTFALSPKQARTLSQGSRFLAAAGYLPNVFITIRWDSTVYADQPFKGLQRILERLRKSLSAGVPCAYLWVRELEATEGAIEHAHIAIYIPACKRKKLMGSIRNWLGTEHPSAVVVKPIFDAFSLISGYFLKGGTDAVRTKYLTCRQRQAWSGSQGVISGKRSGVSQLVTDGIRYFQHGPRTACEGFWPVLNRRRTA